jgi:YidC/Oxa1 family membrane protein insertase
VHPADIDKGKATHVKQANNGWLAFVQHYFVSAWLPAQGVARDYVTEKRQDRHVRRARDGAAHRRAGREPKLTVPLYTGPSGAAAAARRAPGLDLVVDYGWLAIIAWPLFWLLEKFHALSGNWGVPSSCSRC